MQQHTQPVPEAAHTKRLLLVDGYGFLFRAYHSLPPLTNPEGVPVGAVYGFMTMLVKLLMAKEADYVAVVLDAGKKTFRNTLYPAYKAHRPPAPDDLIPQFSLVRKAIEALNVPVMELEGYEADDLIATYAVHAVDQGMQVTIVSGDKDLTQLINASVKLYDPMKFRYVTAEQVKEKYGVLPDKMLDLLALTGDSSDNIPGVPGIGPKTAAQLLEEFGSLDGILAQVEKIKQEKRRISLIEHRENALLSRDLVRLCTTVPMDRAIETLRVHAPDRAILTQFLAMQGFKTLMTRLEKEGWIKQEHHIQPPSDVKSAAMPAYSAPATERVEHVCAIDDEKTLQDWLLTLKNPETLAMYLHWDKKTQVPLLMALATEGGRVGIISLLAVPAVSQGDLFSQAVQSKGITLQKVLNQLTPLLQNDSILKIGYDIKRLLRCLWQEKSDTMLSYDDVMLMSYLLNTGVFDHTLPEMFFQYLGIEKENYHALDDKKATPEALHASLARVVLEIIPLYTYLKQGLIGARLLTLYERLEKPLIDVLAQMEKAGIKVDLAMLHALSEAFTKEIFSLEQKIYDLAGKEFNIASPKQLGELLFSDLGLVGGKKSKKTQTYSTDNEVLEKLAADGAVIAEHLIQWRSFSKLKNTYTDALAKQIQTDGRVHTHYAMAAVNTGRLSSYDPNLQNIPIRTAIGNTIREVFIAEKNYLLLSADYSQIELRLLADMAGIESLQAAFHEGKDIHAITASQIFSVPLEAVTDELRRRAKTINFGIIYGMSGFGLARRLGIERSEAAAYINAYFTQYPGIVDYMERTKATAREHGYVTTLLGRRCAIKGMNDKNGVIRQFAERAAINAPLQGSAADIIKKAMIDMQPKLKLAFPNARILLQVHDELVIEVPEAEAEAISEYVRQIMEKVVTLSVPLTVSVGIGKNWRESH